MTFAFEHHGSVRRQVRSIASQQIDKALSEAQASADFDKTVHALRRRCKKLRGLLRLVEPALETFKSENAAVRDAAGALGQSRDAAVVVETLDWLVAERGGDLPSEVAETARMALVQRVDTIAAQASSTQLLAEFSGALAKVGKRAGDWAFSERGFGLIGNGLALTYGRMRKAARFAANTGGAEEMHEWRKHTKSHLYHVMVLRRCAPDVLDPRRSGLDRLSEQLGDHHNLAVLASTLQEPAIGLSRAERETLLPLISECQYDFARSAIALGQQTVVEKPAALRRRFAGYWSLLEADA